MSDISFVRELEYLIIKPFHEYSNLWFSQDKYLSDVYNRSNRGIFHGLGKATKGLGSKFSKAFPGISDELSNCFRALSGKAKDDLIALGRYIDDIVNRLNPKGVAVDAYGETYSLPNDKTYNNPIIETKS